MSPSESKSSVEGGRLEGLLCLDKPVGITSAKALYRVRTILRQRKSGHAGTLDPAASGVLLLCLGGGTKLVERIMDLPKVYRATARLDVTSESFDSDRPWVEVEMRDLPTRERFLEALLGFEGVTQQIPPQISAVKIGGVPAYERYRRGQAIELTARPVVIYWFSLRTFDWPVVEFDMCCSRGTYVRALMRDIGLRLGTGGCLTALERRGVGPFTIDNAIRLETLATDLDPSRHVFPLMEARAMIEAAHGQIPPCPV